MGRKSEAKIGNKIAAAVITAAALLSFTSILHAEDYPAGYLGAGYREYLGHKIQNGYYVEVFNKIDVITRAAVDKRNEIEGMVDASYQAAPETRNSVFAAEYQQKDNSDKLKTDIAKQSQQREKITSTETNSNYIKYSDGKIEYFKDGLVDHVENERSVDSFGNLSLKNTYNIKYNDKRLMISYDASITGHLGNTSKIRWWGASYTGDSVYYGNKKTTANRNLTEYYMEETDSAGNVSTTHWQSLSYEGKAVRAFKQTDDNSVYGHNEFTRSNITYAAGDIEKADSYREEGTGADGLHYTLNRINIGYNETNQATGYHEEKTITQLDGTQTKTKADVKFKYLAVPKAFSPDVEDPDPARLLESTSVVTTENPDGSTKTETENVTYQYNANNTIIGAAGHTDFNGQEAKWWKYTDTAGHRLIRKEKDGVISYSYVDPQTKETVTVANESVAATLMEGDKFSGTMETGYEILYGAPMKKKGTSTTSYYSAEENQLIRVSKSTIDYSNGLVKNIQRLLETHESTQDIFEQKDAQGKPQTANRDIITRYIYALNGNLTGAEGTGTGYGYELTSDGWMKFASKITVTYKMILGELKEPVSEEIRDHYTD